MAKKPLDPSTLTAFANAAAGHDGVLSDESGSMVVKPCTPTEIAFYESVTADHPDLAPYLPTFMGTLQLAGEEGKPPATYATIWEQPAEVRDAAAAAGVGVVETENGIERLHGRKLDTDLSIVLENVAFGFKKPNILDLKLGTQLWDEGANLDKRKRLDKVAAETTSSSLGFRIAGMRTWQGDNVGPVDENIKGLAEAEKETGYWVYNKIYGRKFTAENKIRGFRDYVLPSCGGEKKSPEELERAVEVLEFFKDEIQTIQKMFEGKESRMYSASLLLVYEGDPAAYKETKSKWASLPPKKDQEEEEDDEDDDEAIAKLATVKCIDFAHATWTPGQGPDENALRGIRSTVEIIEKLIFEINEEKGEASKGGPIVKPKGGPAKFMKPDMPELTN